MRVLIQPHLSQLGAEESGIRRVIEAHFRWLPALGVELVQPKASSYDLLAVHAGAADRPDVAHTHGLYWTADYDAPAWEFKVNQRVIENVRQAKIVTVPSRWVAESFQRDLHLDPELVPNGIDWQDWQGIEPEAGNYVLWNKNRTGDVCDPGPMEALARQFRTVRFLSTFASREAPNNIRTLGIVPHDRMRQIVAGALLYLSTTKETFGIGTLEAMACGVPVLGFDQGGNRDLVKHGITGYLAQPGNLEDLASGFSWCIEHREALGANGREAARSFSWEAASQALFRAYQKALEPEPPSAAVVIPSFNYADKVGRAISAAQAQYYPFLDQIIVVDDGSDDQGATEALVREKARSDPRIRYLRQENRGVAHARNTGIAQAKTKYVCCLDADDSIEPGFLSVCIDALEADRSLGVAYTRLRWVQPDGLEGVSAWPAEFDYDQQLRHKNQIPTCCVFRRKMWERLGGYRQRYAPKGAGSEDAEFWTRAGALGWGAKLASTKPLFLYSWLSGRVSGDKAYQEPDWLGWHPWAKDQQHPFGSLATPRKISHPVRQYDEPMISVVIPVGPGHEADVVNALDSLEAQTFRKWEAIVVFDSPVTDFSARAALLKAYPFVRPLYADMVRSRPGEQLGAGAARNIGAGIARAPFLVFLDADDWLYPEALEKMVKEWEVEPAIIYTDYVGKAEVDDPSKLDPALQQRLYSWDGKHAVIGYRSANFDPERAQRQPEGPRPYHWAIVTCLIPRAWHQEIGGFDEAMPSWEDVDYHFRLARRGHCFRRLPEELIVYRFNTGQRRQQGVQNHQELVEYMRRKYEESEPVPCNCGAGVAVKRSKQFHNVAQVSALSPAAAQANGKEASMQDQDFKLAVYLSPNRGQHRVIGPSTKINYGYRKGGDQFLVHVQDIATNGHLYRLVENAPIPAPVPAPPPTPPAISGSGLPEPPQAPAAVPAAPVSQAPFFDVHSLPGVTKPIAEQLLALGVGSVDDVLALGAEGLQQINGVGEVKAQRIIEAVQAVKALAEQA